MYLQLAEGENNGNYSALAEGVFDNYVFIPAGFLPEFPQDSYVRADYFNKYDANTADQIINALAAYQKPTLNEGLVQSALTFIPGVGPVASQGLNLAKKLVQQRQEKVAAGQAKPLGKPGGFLDKLRQKMQAPGTQTKSINLPDEPVGASVTTPQGQFNVGFQPATAPATGTFWQKYKTPIIIGGAAVALIGGYMLLKKRK
jgi:hypothetical protein